MKKSQDNKELLENEWYHVRHSGEIPEVALHSSIYFLTEDSDGPSLELQEEDYRLLNDAALKRYREIILRDILPENRDATLYRGLLRSICNWRRLKRFCQRNALDSGPIKEETKDQLKTFLQQEMAEVSLGARSCCINCTFEELHSFCVELGVSLSGLRSDLEKYCPTR